MQKNYTDIPVAKIDGDKFNVKVYIDSMAEFIEKCSTPMTIAIQGDWGSGKTSMMNMIKELLDGKVHSIWFNTWQYSQFNMGESLPISFLSYLTGKIDDSKKESEAKEKVVKAVKVLAQLGGRVALSYAGISLPTDDKDIKAPDFAKAVEEIKVGFQQIVSGKTANGRDRIVIFVDDLDRLPPERAVELLEVLKLFTDVEGCVFVLAVDYGVVSQGVKSKYGNSVSEDKGRSFFDKIIQLPFQMPVELYDLSEYVKEAMDSFGIDVEDNDLSTYKNLIVSSIGRNPRSMKRLFNTYQLIKMVLVNKNKGKSLDNDTNRILFAVLCMQMAYPDLYSAMLLKRGNLKKEDLMKKEDELLKYIYTQEKERDAKKYLTSRMAAYLDTLMLAIQLDNDEDISAEEIKKLKEVLEFSSVTSVGGTDSQSGEIQWDKRTKCRSIAKLVLTMAKDKYDNQFKIYQSNKDHYAKVYCTPKAGGIKSELSVKIDINEVSYDAQCEYFNWHKGDILDFEKMIESCLKKDDYVRKDNQGSNLSYIIKEKFGIASYKTNDDELKIAKLYFDEYCECIEKLQAKGIDVFNSED